MGYEYRLNDSIVKEYLVKMSALSELERNVSIRIIQKDAESIYSLLQTERDSIFLMEIIPYYALFVQSCHEYMGENFLQESIAKDLKDIRNHIKIYAEGFRKSQKRVTSIDDAQDRDFKGQLRFKFLKKMNIHLNLGTYWTDDKHIIGNTQQLADFLSVDSMFNPKQKDKYYQIGCQIGSFVASIRDGLAETSEVPIVERKSQSVVVNYYCDINTNKKNILFLDSTSKELKLFFLHLLCNMNFVKYMLKPLFTDENTWVFRVEYIVSYYTLRALERLKNYCENNKGIAFDTKGIGDILKKGNDVFKSKFRNCMMHYSLENQDVLCPEYLNRPLYGIVESCFDGTDFYVYLRELREFSDGIIGYLEDKFDFSHLILKSL